MLLLPRGVALGLALTCSSISSPRASILAAETPDAPVPRPTDEYLDEYALLYDHVGMLMDGERMRAYHDAIMLNAAQHFKGKVVLDVGTGTGILAIWAAQAGAKRVYAVEASSIGTHASTMIAAHGLSDKITLIRGRLEEIELPEFVDVLISEWMGYFLLRESMVGSILVARDKYLKHEGVMYPSEARLLVAPLHSPSFREKKAVEHEEVLANWDALAQETSQRYSLDLGALRASYEKEGLNYMYNQAFQGHVPGDVLAGEGVPVLEVDMKTVTSSELFGWKSAVTLRRFEPERPVHAICGWFDVRFCSEPQDGGEGGDGDDSACVELDTSPNKPGTHWGQSVFLLEEELIESDIEVSLKQSRKNHHDINVTFGYAAATGAVTASYDVTADFRGYDD